MHTTVLASTEVVKTWGDDSGTHPRDTQVVTTLAERLALVLERTGWSQRELSRRAGLTEVHVGQVLRRAKAKGADAAVESSTLEAIAKAADVSYEWLATGTGAPEDRAPARRRGTRWEDHAGWAAAVEEAQRKYPMWVAPFAYRHAGLGTRVTSGKTITPELALQLARVWQETADEQEFAEASAAWTRETALAAAQDLPPDPTSVTDKTS